ncbi:MAG: hypothetical protein NTU94_00875 [Planctomycetota bacterium]|nr:hypothetical protein [Planctomycetota bacterium]
MAGISVVGAAIGSAWTKKPSMLYLARLIELQRPDLKNALLTFVELHQDPQADPTLTSALGRRAARLLADAEPQMFLPPTRLRRPAMAAASAALLLGAGLWLAQGILFTPWVTGAEARSGPYDMPPQAGGMPTVCPPVAGPSLRGQADPSEKSCPREQRRGHATPANGDTAVNGSVPRPVSSGGAESGDVANSAQAIAADLKADAAKFDLLGATLGSDGGASREDPGSRNTSGPTSNSSVPRPVLSGRGEGRQDALGGDGTPRPSLHGHTVPADESGPREQRRGHATQADGRDTPPKPQGTDARDQANAGAPPPANGNAGQGGGGDARSAGPSGRASAGEPPLAKRTPGEKFPLEVLDSMRRTKRIITRAEELLREGEVSEAFLANMEMTNAEFRRFVTSWQRKLEAAAHGPDAVSVPLPADAAPGSGPGELLRPVQAASPAGGEVRRGSDGSQGLVQGSEARVSPRLRPAVAGYFEAIGRMGGPGSRKGDAK